METSSIDNTATLWGLIIDFAHEELLNQFLNTKGDCSESTFSLLRSISSNEILTLDHEYKFQVSNLIFHFSNYLKIEANKQAKRIKCLLSINERIFDETIGRVMPIEMINDFRKASLKTMQYLVKCEQNELDLQVRVGNNFKVRFIEDLKEFIEHQELLIDDAGDDDYTNERLCEDICNILRNDRYLNKQPSLLKSIIESTGDRQKAFFDAHSSGFGNKVPDSETTSNHEPRGVVPIIAACVNEDEVILIDSDDDLPTAIASSSITSKIEATTSNLLDDDDVVYSSTITKFGNLNIDESSFDKAAAAAATADEETLKQKKRKKEMRTPWQDKETVYLVLGVEKHGKGAWSKILSDFKSKFNDRTNVDLKDRYRNLEKNEENLDRLKKQAQILHERKTLTD